MQNKSSETTIERSPQREGEQEAQLRLPPLGRMESVEVDQDAVLMEIQGGAVLVDKDMVETLSQHSWSIGAIGYAVGYISSKYKRSGMVPGSGGMYMHRFIMGDIRGVVYDHKNGIKLDNRRSNLRRATHSENHRNTPKYKTYRGSGTSSNYKGVSLRTDTRRWKAYIKTSTGQLSLGSYATEEEAALAYNKAAVIHFGEFAKLNDIIT